MRRKPVLNVSCINPRLLAVVPELDQARRLREKVLAVKRYLVVCRLAAKRKVLLCLSDRQHFVDGVDFYSMEDLEDVRSGRLIRYLEDKISAMVGHVRSCVLCRAKGFICELCKSQDQEHENEGRDFSSGGPMSGLFVTVRPEGPHGATGSAPGELLFPFDEDAAECPECLGVFHRHCFKIATSVERAGAGCPRCARKRRIKDAKNRAM